jgi:hypothetical protein
MGTDCAPYLANLYLFALEYKWMTGMESKEETLRILKGVEMLVRFIDDLNGINANDVIERYKKEIYKGLEINKENKEDHKTHFLDLNMVKHYGRVVLSTYDKRDDFKFEVRSYPDLSGNIDRVTAHGVIVGQLGRFANACDHYSHFKERLQSLTGRLLEQGFERELLEAKIKKFYNKQGDRVLEYRRTEEQLVSECFARAGESGGTLKSKGKRKKKKEKDKHRHKEKEAYILRKKEKAEGGKGM